MSNLVDDAVLSLLRAVSVAVAAQVPPGYLGVFDSYVTDSDENDKTISAPTPYLVLYSSLGDPDGHSLAGPAGVTVQEFQVTYVGKDRRQAVWAGEKARTALRDVRLGSVPRNPVIRLSNDTLLVRRDDTWTRPDGGPLFYGADRYSLVY